jgi:cell division protein FtsQ
MVWALGFSPLLDVRHVRVIGASHTTAREVARVAGLDSDDNLLLLSTAEVEERAETLPWVKRAEAGRVLPGTVRVRIVERRPAAVVSMGAARWTVDRWGRVLQVGRARKGLPVLAGSAIEDIEPGAELRAPHVLDALTAFRSLPPRLERRVEAIFAPTLERISFSLDGSTLVRYGPAERLWAKNKVLTAVLKRLRAQGRTAAYIDVRVPTSPAVADAVDAPAAP